MFLQVDRVKLGHAILVPINLPLVMHSQKTIRSVRGIPILLNKSAVTVHSLENTSFSVLLTMIL